MKEAEYWHWHGFFEGFKDLPDGAWWESCCGAIGGYDRMYAWLEAGTKYNTKECTKTERKVS